MASNPPRKRLHFNKNKLRPILFLAGLAFFLALVFQSRQETQAILARIHWPLFLLSVLIAVADNILFSILFQQLLLKYNFPLRYTQVGQMYFLGQMAKYIPGRFWSVLYHATFVDAPGATGAMLAANLDLTAVTLLRNIFIAAALLLFFQQAWWAGAAFLVGAIAFWYLSRSCWITRIFAIVLRFFHLRGITLRACVENLSGKTAFLINSGTWAAFLAANFMVMRAALGFTWEQSALYIAYFGLAWVIGVLSFVVPAGFGIRELVFVLLAQNFGHTQALSTETLAAIAIVYRFWQICHEIGGLGVGIFLNRVQRRFSKVAAGR